MSNAIIKINKTKFDNSKKRISERKEQRNEEVKLKRFNEKGACWGFFDHNVTGSELNQDLVFPLEKELIDINNNFNSLYDFIKEVYDTFDNLDKEYLAGIITAISGAMEASEQARKAFDEAKKAQDDIKKTIDALDKSTHKLKEEHHKNNDKFRNIECRISKAENCITKMNNNIENLKEKFTSLHLFTKEFKTKDVRNLINSLKSQKHLIDIDTIWSNVNTHKNNLSDLTKEVNNLKQKIKPAPQRAPQYTYENKTKGAYIMGGIAIGLTIINMVLQLLGVI